MRYIDLEQGLYCYIHHKRITSCKCVKSVVDDLHHTLRCYLGRLPVPFNAYLPEISGAKHKTQLRLIHILLHQLCLRKRIHEAKSQFKPINRASTDINCLLTDQLSYSNRYPSSSRTITTPNEDQHPPSPRSHSRALLEPSLGQDRLRPPHAWRVSVLPRSRRYHGVRMQSRQARKSSHTALMEDTGFPYLAGIVSYHVADTKLDVQFKCIAATKSLGVWQLQGDCPKNPGGLQCINGRCCAGGVC